MPISISDDGPRLRITMTGRLSSSDFDLYHAALVDRMRACDAAGTKFVVVGDATHASPPDSAVRRRLAAFMAEHEKLAERTVLVSGWTMPNPIQRGVLTAVAWLRKPPVPIRGFGTVAETEAFADAALARTAREQLAELTRQSAQSIDHDGSTANGRGRSE